MSEQCGVIDTMRTPKIFGMALFDWTFSLLGAFIFGRYILKLSGTGQWIAFILFWILLGIVAHVMTKTPTMMNYYLGLSDKPKSKLCAV
jgi:hypothetical protein